MMEEYELKMGELRNMLKSPSYTKTDILTKIQVIHHIIENQKLDIDRLNEDVIVSIAQELQSFYLTLWDAKLIKDWKVNYSKLSLKTRKLYEVNEVKIDWQARQYSLAKYEEMVVYLENESYDLDQLKARFDQYMEEQVFYAERQHYILNWDTICLQYHDQIMKKGKVLGIDQRQVHQISFNMIHCSDGDFWMGINDIRLTHWLWGSAKPKHKIKITQDFWISETQVTQELWEKVMGWNQSYFKGSQQLPVESITWYDCLAFCNQLSLLEGFKPCFRLTHIQKQGHSISKAKIEWHKNTNGYRLATEAEWEYAAMAGMEMNQILNDINDIAWYVENSANQTHEVKKKKANAWGLYDMMGNVEEWCMDKWNERIYNNRNGEIKNPISWENQNYNAYITRGGHYESSRDFCQIPYRNAHYPSHWSAHRGLRLLRCP
jgi:sulfatase modifying factor 1